MATNPDPTPRRDFTDVVTRLPPPNAEDSIMTNPDAILQRLKEGAISAENAYRWAADKKRFQPMLDRAKAK